MKYDVMMMSFNFTGLFELHGNSTVEKCTKCKREYLRDFRVVTRGRGLKRHETGVCMSVWIM